jgi:hypothetical protein
MTTSRGRRATAVISKLRNAPDQTDDEAYAEPCVPPMDEDLLCLLKIRSGAS